MMFFKKKTADNIEVGKLQQEIKLLIMKLSDANLRNAYLEGDKSNNERIQKRLIEAFEQMKSQGLVRLYVKHGMDEFTLESK